MKNDKKDPQEMIAEIANDLIIYLQEGVLEPNSFIEQLNLEVDNLQQLLRIHFLLQERVKEFLINLPQRLREIKTSTTQIIRFLRGE
mgnify:CR=1 FL=1